MISVTGSLKTSKDIHFTIIGDLLHAKIAYFDTQPIGRIINRLSTDLDRTDVNLMNSFDGLQNSGGQMAASTIMIVVSAPWVTVVLIPASAFAYSLQALYRVYVSADICNRHG